MNSPTVPPKPEAEQKYETAVYETAVKEVVGEGIGVTAALLTTPLSALVAAVDTTTGRSFSERLDKNMEKVYEVSKVAGRTHAVGLVTGAISGGRSRFSWATLHVQAQAEFLILTATKWRAS